MSHNQVSLPYAKALYDLAFAQNNVDEVYGSLTGILGLGRQIPALREFLENPLLSVEERAQVLKALFSSRVHPLVYKFLLFANLKGRLNMLMDIIPAFDALYLDDHQRIRAQIQTALPLDEKVREDVRQHLSQKYGKEVIADWQIRKDLLGGFRILIAGNLHDYSFTCQLARYRDTIK